MSARPRWLVFVLVPVVGCLGVTVGFALCDVVASKRAATTTAPDAPSSDPFKQESPPNRGLDANLYMQTSAEYRACCLQAYNLADERVRAKLATRGQTAKPPAVVFDLDETVLDNAEFQSRQLRSGRAYDQKLWDEWEEKDGGQVGLVPGAKEFIGKLTAAKVHPVYLTNRNEKFRDKTKEVLKRLEIEVPNGQLHLASDTSDKTKRRAVVVEKFDVLLWVGDNLRDFDEAFKYDKAKGLDGRKRVVDERKDRFGADWIILPNPAYGEWAKAFSNGPADLDLLPSPKK